MSAVEELKEKLKELGSPRIHASWNPDSTATPEERAQELLKVIAAIQRGDYEVIEEFGDAAELTPAGEAMREEFRQKRAPVIAEARRIRDERRAKASVV
jgi:hypothetical protein